MIKKQPLCLIALSVLVLAGCQKEGVDNGLVSYDGTVKYAVVMGSDNQKTTRGTLVNTSGSDDMNLSEFQDIVPEFQAVAYDDEGNERANQTVTWNVSAWVGDPVAYWPQATSLTFLAYANLPESEDVATVSYASTGVTLDYNVPEAASAQNDILLGHYQGMGGGTGTAEIRFEHPLTAVQFLRGDIAESLVIKSISIKGVAASGTATMDPDGEIQWSGVSGCTHTVSQTKADGLSVDGTTKLIGEPFIIIQQNVAANNVKVNVTFTCGTTVEATIASGEWLAGKTNTYTLSYDITGYLTVSVMPWNRQSEVELSMDPEPEFIDLGLPSGTRWANRNIGATSETEVGNYYHWGALETSSSYIWANAPFNGGNNAFNSASLDAAIGLGIDSNYRLTAQADIATVLYGSSCHIPTSDQLDELLATKNNTTDYEWTWCNGSTVKYMDSDQKGWLITYRNGPTGSNQIFLPYTGGYMSGTSLLTGTSTGYYWTSDIYSSSKENAVSLYMPATLSSVQKQYSDRRFGLLVRPVKQGPVPMPWVDLGLESGTLWCETNLNASSATEYGLYYQFGSTTGHKNSEAASYSTWSTAPFNGGNSTYNETAWNSYKTSILDSQGNLKVEYDAAYQQTYGAARIPTLAEIEELVALSNEWTDNYNGTGVHGRIFHGNNGNTLFIPAAGCYYGGDEHYIGNNGVLIWSCTANGDENAAYLHSWDISPAAFTDNKPRYYSYPIRPVKASRN